MEDFQPMIGLKLEKLPLDIAADGMLETIFKRQKELFDKYEWAKEYNEEQLTCLYATAICNESQELMGFVNWKPWKKQKKEFNKVESIYELIDILHFVINNLIALGVTPYQCMQYYLAKNKENISRIDRGY